MSKTTAIRRIVTGANQIDGAGVRVISGRHGGTHVPTSTLGPKNFGLVRSKETSRTVFTRAACSRSMVRTLWMDRTSSALYPMASTLRRPAM